MIRICKIPGCWRTVQALGLCSPHYGRLKRHGSPTGGRTPPARGGERRRKRAGWERFISGRGWVREAVLQIEKMGDKRRPGEQVRINSNGTPYIHGRRKRIFCCENCGTKFTRKLCHCKASIKFCSKKCYGQWERGRTSNRAKFTAIAILEIRLVRSAGMKPPAIAARLGVKELAIYRIISGKTYSDIPFQKKGQGFYDCLLEAVAYRSRIANEDEREKRMANGSNRSGFIQKRRLPRGSLRRKVG